MARFTAGATDNILPQTAELEGTVRTLSPAVRDLVETTLSRDRRRDRRRLRRHLRARLRRNYPVTINPAKQTDFAAVVAREVAGTDNVQTDEPPVMGAEDFSFMLEARPGAFIWLGNGDTAGLHHPGIRFQRRRAALRHGLFRRGSSKPRSAP